MAAGCPTTDQKPAKPSTTPAKVEQASVETPVRGGSKAGRRRPRPAKNRKNQQPAPLPETKKHPDLGPPLVDNVDRLKRLDPASPLWVDAAKNQVILIGQVCQNRRPSGDVRLSAEHPRSMRPSWPCPSRRLWFTRHCWPWAPSRATPSSLLPNTSPATGTEIGITLHWKDDKGTTKTAAAQDWVRDAKSGKPMTATWVFGGSRLQLDETTGRQYYQAEGGDFICVSNFSTAMLDLSVESSQANANLQFQAYTERIPPRGTPVTMVLKPKLQ